MVFVKRIAGKSDEALIREFSRKVVDAGIIPEVRRRQFHLKPSLAKKMKKEEARRAKKRVV